MNDKITYFFPKVFNRLSSEKNRIWEYLPIEKISLWGVGRVPSKNEFIVRLHKMLGEFTPEFFKDINPHDREVILKCADQTLNHDFDLLGSGLKHFAQIPWHSDFKYGYTWPKGVYYRKLRGVAPVGSDIKVPWELSRCHHLLWLGEAYLITGDEKYAREVVDEITDWIDENPLMYSVNWTCSMDIAIRAVNWMYALDFIAKSDAMTDDFAGKVYKSLFQHAFFIFNNQEKGIPYSNNHYVSDIIGLLYLGQMFNNSSKGKSWLRFAKKEYYKETLIQIMPSGVNFERSVSYHRLTSELLLYSYFMLKRCGVTIRRDVEERLVKMVAYIANYTKPNDLSPLVADNDDGRLVPFVYRDFRKHSYLTNPGSTEMRLVASEISDVSKFSIFAQQSKCYEDANVAVLHKGALYLFSSCCDRWRYDKNTGAFVGVHLHNDLLSFEYSVGKDDFIVDPGAYLYTSNIKKHNEFHSTRKHSTVMVDGEEQNFLSPTSAFSLKYNCNAEKFTFTEDATCAKCTGEYTTIEGKMTHSRQFDLNESGLTIIDRIAKQGKGHTVYLSFHLAEGVSVEPSGSNIQLKSGDTILMMTLDTKNKAEVSAIDDTISPSFGVLRPSKTISISFGFDEESEIVTKFTIVQ